MSLNVRIEPAGLVLRVHQPFVSCRRLHAVQLVRRGLAQQGLIVPVPIEHRSSTVFRCGDRWAELEQFIPHVRPAATFESYSWMFRAMGDVHQALRTLHTTFPQPLIATYGPPSSLRRWLRVTKSVVRHDAGALAAVQWTNHLLARLERQWVPSNRLPQHPVHGDVGLGNIGRTAEGNAVYLDFGFLARRPRVHDLAYAITFMVIALDGQNDPARFPWQWIPALIHEYESGSLSVLAAVERASLTGYSVAVPLYFTALAGFTSDPVGQLHRHSPWLAISDWLLAHPEALLTS